MTALYDETPTTTITPIKSAFSTLQLPVIKSRRTERGDLLTYFMRKMNPGRSLNGFKEHSIATWGYFLSRYTTSDLYFLKERCEKAKNFEATFNYLVFPKKEFDNKTV